MSNKTRILFICAANDVRSPIAEALLRQMRSQSYEVFSAGMEPSEVSPIAIELLEKLNVSTAGLRSKSVAEFEGEYFDFVICLFGKSAGEYASLVHMGEFMVWDFEDPVTNTRTGAYMKTLEEIRRRIQMFLLVTEKDAEHEGTTLHIMHSAPVAHQWWPA